jgi:hypothetical protein
VTTRGQSLGHVCFRSFVPRTQPPLRQTSISLIRCKIHAEKGECQRAKIPELFRKEGAVKVGGEWAFVEAKNDPPKSQPRIDYPQQTWSYASQPQREASTHSPTQPACGPTPVTHLNEASFSPLNLPSSRPRSRSSWEYYNSSGLSYIFVPYKLYAIFSSRSRSHVVFFITRALRLPLITPLILISSP